MDLSIYITTAARHSALVSTGPVLRPAELTYAVQSHSVDFISSGSLLLHRLEIYYRAGKEEDAALLTHPRDLCDRKRGCVCEIGRAHV